MEPIVSSNEVNKPGEKKSETNIFYLALVVSVILAANLILKIVNISKDLSSNPAPADKIVRNKKIAFLRNGDIWLSDHNGEHQKQITTNLGVDSFRWIPYSTKFVYYPEDPSPENIEVNTVDWTTSQTETIYSHQEKINPTTGQNGGISPHYYAYLTVSPDGKKIAMGDDLIYPNTGIAVYDLNSKKTVLYDKCGSHPEFSNDGTKLAGISWPNIVICSLPEGKPEILTNYIKPNDTVDLSKFAYLENVLGWSGDNQRVYFTISNIGRGNYTWNTINNIESINISTGDLEKVTDYPPGHSTNPLNIYPDTNSLYSLKTDNTVYNSGGEKAGSEMDSMYGYKFAQEGYSISATQTIEKIDLSDKTSTDLFSGNYNQNSPIRFNSVSPDGNIILYSQTSDIKSGGLDRNDIWQTDINTKTRTLLLKNADAPIWIY